MRFHEVLEVFMREPEQLTRLDLTRTDCVLIVYCLCGDYVLIACQFCAHCVLIVC